MRLTTTTPTNSTAARPASAGNAQRGAVDRRAPLRGGAAARRSADTAASTTRATMMTTVLSRLDPPRRSSGAAPRRRWRCARSRRGRASRAAPAAPAPADPPAAPAPADATRRARARRATRRRPRPLTPPVVARAGRPTGAGARGGPAGRSRRQAGSLTREPAASRWTAASVALVRPVALDPTRVRQQPVRSARCRGRAS